MAGRNKSPNAYYFDSCVYLAYLRNETDTYGYNRIRSIKEIWDETECGTSVIVTSTITVTEVLSHKLSVLSEKKFLQALNNGLHQFEDVTPPIALKAREYRDHYEKHPVQNPFNLAQNPRKYLSTPDALHLATSWILECGQFLTFDGHAPKKNDNSIGLLWLGNMAGTDPVIITQPEDTPRLIQGDLSIDEQKAK